MTDVGAKPPKHAAAAISTGRGDTRAGERAGLRQRRGIGHAIREPQCYSEGLFHCTKARLMAASAEHGGLWWRSRWRIAAWGTVLLVLLLPMFAMQFTEEVAWDLADFVVFGAMLVGAGTTIELAARTTRNRTYLAAVGIALTAAFILVWMNAAVGIIGNENNPANLMYGGVLAVGAIGAIIRGFRPDGMASALFATALVQALVCVIAIIAGMGYPESPPLEIVGVNALFVVLWFVSALLFRKAAREQIRAQRSAEG